MMVRQMHQARVVWGTSAAPDQADSCDHAVKCQTAMIELRVLLLLIHRSSVLTSGTANACGWICARVRSSERQFRAERNLVSPKVTFFFRTWMQTPIATHAVKVRHLDHSDYRLHLFLLLLVVRTFFSGFEYSRAARQLSAGLQKVQLDRARELSTFCNAYKST